MLVVSRWLLVGDWGVGDFLGAGQGGGEEWFVDGFRQDSQDLDVDKVCQSY